MEFATMGHCGVVVRFEGGFMEILHDVFREWVGLKACGNMEFGGEEFRVELVEAFIHPDFGKSGFKVIGFH